MCCDPRRPDRSSPLGAVGLRKAFSVALSVTDQKNGDSSSFTDNHQDGSGSQDHNNLSLLSKSGVLLLIGGDPEWTQQWNASLIDNANEEHDISASALEVVGGRIEEAVREIFPAGGISFEQVIGVQHNGKGSIAGQGDGDKEQVKKHTPYWLRDVYTALASGNASAYNPYLC